MGTKRTREKCDESGQVQQAITQDDMLLNQLNKQVDMDYEEKLRRAIEGQ